MAFEADCGVSTVLETLRAASTPGHPWVWLLEALATWPHVPAARRPWVPGRGCNLGDGKSEIRNSKSEIFRSGTADSNRFGTYATFQP